MADPRILQFQIPLKTSPATTHFQIGASNDGGENWTLLKRAGTSDLAVNLLTDRVYTLDGVNGTDDASNNAVELSMPPMRYRLRLKHAGGYEQWLEPFVFPSSEDFILALQEELKDPALDGGQALLSVSDYRRKIANAVGAFELKQPRSTSQVYALTSDEQSYDLPDLWQRTYSRVTGCEYPTGEEPRTFIPADYIYIDEDVSEWRFTRIYPGTGESARLYYTTRHARDGSTVPVTYFESVLAWAVADCAEQLARKFNQFGDFYSGSEITQTDPRVKTWRELAKTGKAQAEAMWGQGASGVRTRMDLYEDHGRIPAQVWSV